MTRPAGAPPPPDEPPPGLSSGWRRIPLWLRLVSTLLLLAFAGLTLMGTIGLRQLRAELVHRVDNQLHEATNGLTTSGDELQPGAPAEPQQELPSEFVYEVLNAEGGYHSGKNDALLDPDEPLPDLPSLDALQGASRAGDPFTVDATEGSVRWRVLATPVFVRDLPGRGTLLVATSLEDTDTTVAKLFGIDLVVGGFVLLGLAVAGYAMVRAAMRPLTDIERTAAAIARGDLSRRIPDEDPRTEVGRLGRALNAMLERIEGAFRARESSEATARRSEEKMRRFVADASHELRTPLTSIRGFAELHRQGAVTDPEEVSRLLGRIEDEATRMGLLVEDLLQLARLDQQRPFQSRPVDLVVVAADAVEAARTRAPDRPIRLEVVGGADAAPDDADDDDDDEDEDEAAGVVVPGDEPRLRQVVTNLVDNALQHTPAGSQVTVRVVGPGAAPNGPDTVSVEVRDRGPGLSREQADRVFERFYRTDAARSRAQGGTGLGLSIVSAIAQAHRGRVDVDAVPGEGATFRLILPRDAAAPAVTRPAPPPPPAAPPPPPPSSPPPPSPPAATNSSGAPGPAPDRAPAPARTTHDAPPG